MKEYTKRRFLEKYRWQLWSAQDLTLIHGQTPRFWDDSTISMQERKQIQWFVGVEVHDLSIVLAVYGYWREQIYLGPITKYDTTVQGYEKMVADLSLFTIHRFLMETSGIYHFQVYWELTTRFPQTQVIVMNAYDLARYIKRTRKSDKADAVKLAQIARYEELLRPSYCPPREHAYLRDLCRQYTHLKTEMVKIKNRIKKLLAMYGFRWDFEYNNQEQVMFLKNFLQTAGDLKSHLQNYPEMNRSTLEKIIPWQGFNPPQQMRKILFFEFGQLAIRNTEIEMMEAEITHLVKNDAELASQIPLLEEIPGLGWLNSVCLLMEIGKIHRFATMGRFVVYCGIGPAGGSSGAPELGSAEEKVVQKDRPNRKCNPVLKRILTQAAMVDLKQARLGRTTTDITRYAAKFPDDKKKRLKHRFKVAAKIARQLYHCLKHQERFNDQGSALIPENARRNSHNKRIQAKIRRLEKTHADLDRAWIRIFDHLTAMGIDTQTLEQLQKDCTIKEANV